MGAGAAKAQVVAAQTLATVYDRLGFVAVGQTFVVLCRSLDLYVGYVVALCSLIGATTMALITPTL